MPIKHKKGRHRENEIPPLSAAELNKKHLLNNLDKIPQYDEAWICGPGPHFSNAIAHLPKPNPRILTIALNSLVTFDYPWTWWLCYDINAVHFDWYRQGSRPPTLNVLGRNLADGREHYVIDVKKRIKSGHPCLSRQYLLNGATVAGVGLQICWNLGIKMICQAGVDFYGREHFNGSLAGRFKETWPQVTSYNQIACAMRRQGFTIRSLTQTMANVPRIGD